MDVLHFIQEAKECREALMECIARSRESRQQIEQIRKKAAAIRKTSLEQSRCFSNTYGWTTINSHITQTPEPTRCLLTGRKLARNVAMLAFAPGRHSRTRYSVHSALPSSRRARTVMTVILPARKAGKYLFGTTGLFCRLK